MRTSPTVDSTPKIRETSPSLPFDKAAAEAALAKGHATITGVACAYHDNRLFLADNRQVMLFPATPYFEEWVALRKKSDRSKESVLMSDPGLQHAGRNQDRRHRRVPVHRHAAGPLHRGGAVPVRPGQVAQRVRGHQLRRSIEVEHYDRQDYAVARNDELFKDVEVKSDGSTVKTAVTGGANMFSGGGGLIAKMMPCKGGK